MADSDLACGGMNYGKRIPKLAKLSPDGWFQVCICVHGIMDCVLLFNLITHTDGNSTCLLSYSQKICANL